MKTCRGYNIGVRLIDEFLAKSNVSRCVDFKETAEVIAKVGLYYLIRYILKYPFVDIYILLVIVLKQVNSSAFFFVSAFV